MPGPAPWAQVDPPAAPPAAIPLFGERALHLPEDDAVVVGDLHVGLESDLRRAGVHLPSQTHRMRERLLKLVHETGARRLVVIGDLKHRIPYSTRQERSELPFFFEDFPCDVELVPGNHDVDLEGLLAVRTHPSEGIRIGDVGLLHGHAWPSEEVMAASTVVMCHNHPAVMLVDELGHRHKEPAWVRASFTPAARERYALLPEGARLVVMPAFNELTGGTAFNAKEGERLLGPFFGNGFVDVPNARLWTVDGVDLGPLERLKRFGEEKTPASRYAKARAGRRERRPGFID